MTSLQKTCQSHLIIKLVIIGSASLVPLQTTMFLFTYRLLIVLKLLIKRTICGQLVPATLHTFEGSPACRHMQSLSCWQTGVIIIMMLPVSNVLPGHDIPNLDFFNEPAPSPILLVWVLLLLLVSNTVRWSQCCSLFVIHHTCSSDVHQCFVN